MTKLSKYTNRCNVCKVIIKYGNFKRHLRNKHRNIFYQECSANIIKNDFEEENDSTEKYMSEQKSHTCKVCATEIQGNMSSHLKHSHPTEYIRLQDLRKLKEKTITSSSLIDENKWVKKFSTQISARTHECDICKKVLTSNLGARNLIRHFKFLHPAIYAEETHQHSDSDTEIETQGEEPSSPSNRTPYYNQGWVKKYCEKNEDKKSQCNVCKQLIRVPNGYSNMVRHFKNKHITIYEMETTPQLSSNDDDINEEKESDYQDEGTQNEEQEYIIEYIVKETPAENSTSTTEQEPFINKPKKRKYRSWVRKYMNKVGDDDQSYECVICKTVIKLANSSVNNMKRHIASKHSFIYKSEKESLPGSRSVNEESKETENLKECGVYVIEETFLENVSELPDKDSDETLQDDEVQKQII